MHDPYTPPDALGPALPGTMGSSTRGMQWRRVLLGSVALFLALAAWSFMAGFLIPTVGFWLAPDGAWIDTAIVVRKVVYMMVSTFAYWWFAKGVGHRRLLHVLLAWSLVQVIDTETHQVVADLRPGPGVLHMEFTSRGDQLWLSVRDGDEVQVWDPYSLKPLSTLPATAPSGIFFSSRAQKMGY